MLKHLSIVLASLALSSVAFAQQPPPAPQDDPYLVGIANNLNIGDSALNLSNSGAVAGFYPNNLGAGNLCVNVYVFDPSEEEVACCACLVTPNGLNSLSVKGDLINNTLTPAIPTSVVIKLVATIPGTTAPTGTLTTCAPQTAGTIPTAGLLAWGYTLEPSVPAGTYNAVTVPYIPSTLSGFPGDATGTEYNALTTICGFIQANGTGYGKCGTCGLGGLAGARQ
jgi:hypothetical protein